jgi:putative GTP pyrophosphokinase
MMGEKELIQRFEKEVPIYSAWGNLVTNTILNGIRTEIKDDRKFREFVKIPPQPRIKDTDSLVEKAFYRNKKYIDPYNDITDKVGTRFVVLLVDDIKLLSKIVESEKIWETSKDRDFEEERNKHPLVFDYQSVHYIIRNRIDRVVDQILVPKHTACEVQLRTLLQHAHSELTHDTIYKPNIRVIPEIVRVVGRSMALIEATDDYFTQVKTTMNSIEQRINNFFDDLRVIFSTIARPEPQPKLNLLILDAYRDVIEEIMPQTIQQFIERNTFLKERIRERQQDFLIYRQPIILLMYYLLANEKSRFRQLWPFSDNELQPIFTDLGIAFDS